MTSGTSPIQKKRRISEIITAATHYVVSNARTLFSGVGLFAIPLILLAKLVAFSLTGSRRSLDMVLSYKKSLSTNSFLLLATCLVLFIAGMCIFNLFVSKTLVLNDSPGERKRASFNEVKNDLAKDLRDFAISFLIIYVIYFMANEGLNYLHLELSDSSDPYATTPLGVFSHYVEASASYLPALLVLLLTAVCLFFCLSALFICYRDKIGATDALQKVAHYFQKYPKKAWLTSALLLFISYAAHGFIRTVFNFFQFMVVYTNYTTIAFIFDLLQTILDCGLFIFFQVAIILLYGSIEDEAEGYSLKAKIEEV